MEKKKVPIPSASYVGNKTTHINHCYTMGPLLRTWVPMGTFMGILVPFFYVLGPLFFRF